MTKSDRNYATDQKPGYRLVAAGLFTIWLVNTAFNVTKAVHIDDTVYLQIAMRIVESPFRPMSGEMFWGHETTEPIHITNQPHLIPYLYASVIAIFGESEPLLHLVFSIFTLISGLFFYVLARRYIPNHAMPVTAMYCLGPAFLPSQNLMVDVPLTATCLAVLSTMALGRTDSVQSGKYYMIAALLMGFACLIKYTALVFLPLLIIDIVLKKRWKCLSAILVTVSILAIWSVFNYLDYGGVHILQRGEDIPLELVPERAVTALICLGAISPFSIVICPLLRSDRQLRIYCLWIILLALLFASCQFGVYMDENRIQSLLRTLFFMNGVIVVGVTVWCIGHGFSTDPSRLRVYLTQNHDIIVLGLLGFGLAAFVILFAPFIAVRHFLLIIPAVLLVWGQRIICRVSTRWVALTLIISTQLGITLGISDWVHADLYRTYAKRISNEYSGRTGDIWYVGHWGWQWYASRAGMRLYDKKRSTLKIGDLVVSPFQIEKQRISLTGNKVLSIVDEVTIQPKRRYTLRTLLNKAGFYSSSIQYLPWTISSQPIETFRILEVRERISG